MDLCINLKSLKKNQNWYSNPYPKVKIFLLYFKLSNSKFAKDLQNTQTQNTNTQKIENPNPDLKLVALLGAYVWIYLPSGFNDFFDAVSIGRQGL